MTKDFKRKVISEGIVDTKDYRYEARKVTRLDRPMLQIRRLPIKFLETKNPLWEVVHMEFIDY